MITMQRPATEAEICEGITREELSLIAAMTHPIPTPSEAATEEGRRLESAGAPHSIERHEELLVEVQATGRRYCEVSDELEEQLAELQSGLDVLTAEPDRPSECYSSGELHEYLTFVVGLLRIITDPFSGAPGLEELDVWIRKDEAQVVWFVTSVVVAEFHLLLMVHLQHGHGVITDADGMGAVLLRAFELQDRNAANLAILTDDLLFRLRQGTRNRYPACRIDIGPAKRQDLAASRSQGCRHLAKDREPPSAPIGRQERVMLLDGERHLLTLWRDRRLTVGDWVE
jgi:hypothetical protein